MHEMSLAEGVLQIVEEAAAASGFRRVRKVSLAIGRLAAVEPDALRFCFESVARGSIAEGTALEIVEVAGSGWCGQCARMVPMAEAVAACPHCGNWRLRPSGGTEMKVTSLEVD